MKLHPKLIDQAIAQRKKTQSKPIILLDSFAKQNAFVLDENRFIAAQCSRRSGKTNGLALRFLKTLEKHPRSQCLYLALTRDSARDIMLPVLKEMNERFQLGCTFVESRLTMTHPNGAKLILMGADQAQFIRRIKGRKFPGVAIDEAQDFGSHLSSLIDDVLTPSIADYADGWLAVTGTPGPVPYGTFFDITYHKKYGFSVHEWTLLDNPYMPQAAEFIKELCAKREWQENNPTLLREYRNKWILDVQSLWIRYNEKDNHYAQLPSIAPHKWNHIMGVDLGYKDADALAVLAWSEHSPNTYLIEEKITTKQGITELVNQIEDLRKKYDINRIVIDEGGLGKKIAEEIRRQKGIPIEMADKMLKQQNVEFLNDALRTGKFKAKGTSQFAKDSYLVQIDWDKTTPDKIVIKKKPHSDIIDAVLYAFKESPAYAYQAEVSKPKYGTKEWADTEETRMYEAEKDAMEREAQLTEWQREWFK